MNWSHNIKLELDSGAKFTIIIRAIKKVCYFLKWLWKILLLLIYAVILKLDENLLRHFVVNEALTVFTIIRILSIIN